ncbi:ubiquinone biosynthesis O-methyltransferase, mitochondrial-like [Rosa chinensis]|uniref:ubiquinone biosynthesis O-methyltransferase, mitochondrial-like n=1 Tax=Rosa chinensis TaxID=74649 RepID=UPI001AD902A6|nr:ubiquinone biosynthesis O-methyltransferase, mitochondrial-like [Rosa chinensis]
MKTTVGTIVNQPLLVRVLLRMHLLNGISLVGMVMEGHLKGVAMRDPLSARPFEGLKFIDVGCGGGILSEPLARMRAAVTGVDAVKKNIKIARFHSDLDPVTSKLECQCTTAVKSYNAEKGRANKVPKLRLLPGVPKQPGGIECGYYVMRYMKDIINDDTLSFSTKWAVKTRKGYTQQQLDEVRMEVADYLQTLL